MGSGILALAEAKLGAVSVVGFDSDTWSYENARENIRLNDVCSVIELRLGSIECVHARGYTLIAANINRNVLLKKLPAFVARSAVDGIIIVSGLQLGDREIMLRAVEENNLDVFQKNIEADWWSAAAIRRPALCEISVKRAKHLSEEGTSSRIWYVWLVSIYPEVKSRAH